jgi:hypothetical protein
VGGEKQAAVQASRRRWLDTLWELYDRTVKNGGIPVEPSYLTLGALRRQIEQESWDYLINRD